MHVKGLGVARNTCLLEYTKSFSELSNRQRSCVNYIRGNSAIVLFFVVSLNVRSKPQDFHVLFAWIVKKLPSS